MTPVAWDPDQYLRFAGHRERPGIELAARIPDVEPATVVDLGCGTGSLTALLADRWPNARVVGIDSSEEMVERARAEHPLVEFTVADIAQWKPEQPVDVVFSNAALHWLDDHEPLFRGLRSFLSDRGVMAVQMPDNWSEPTHTVPASILDEPEWPDTARSALVRHRVSRPSDYASWLQPARVDMWRTTYYQQLTGADPVWEWVTGSVLRPVLAELDGTDSDRFIETCKQAYRDAYPQGPDGVTTLPFSRLFIIAGM